MYLFQAQVVLQFRRASAYGCNNWQAIVVPKIRTHISHVCVLIFRKAFDCASKLYVAYAPYTGE